MFPHGRVHGGGKYHLPSERQVKSRQELISYSVRKFGQKVGSSGCNNEKLVFLRHPDMLHRACERLLSVLLRKQLCNDFLAGECSKRERLHKLLRRPGHYHPYLVPALLEQPNKLSRLVGRYSAADAQYDAHGCGVLFSRCCGLFSGQVGIRKKPPTSLFHGQYSWLLVGSR